MARGLVEIAQSAVATSLVESKDKPIGKLPLEFVLQLQGFLEGALGLVPLLQILEKQAQVVMAVGKSVLRLGLVGEIVGSLDTDLHGLCVGVLRFRPLPRLLIRNTQ